MALTGAQVRGKIKNIAKSNRADARILMRIYMMERFLERVANSPYSENFIIKGGILVTSMIGISMRSTMDIDTSIRSLDLSEEEALHIINKISKNDYVVNILLFLNCRERVKEKQLNQIEQQ